MRRDAGTFDCRQRVPVIAFGAGEITLLEARPADDHEGITERRRVESALRERFLQAGAREHFRFAIAALRGEDVAQIGFVQPNTA